MKKSYITIILSIIILIGLIYLISELGILKLYHSATTANEPGLKLKSKMIVTNLISPKKGDFICYDRNDEMFGQGIWVHRLIAKENDTLLIENGTIYVNGENFDKKIELMHFYKINENDFKRLEKNNQINDITVYNSIGKDIIINLKDKVALEFGIENKKIISPKDEFLNETKEIYKNDWNKDFFGKLIIPKDKYFVVGDNRDNSHDSRYIGLIDKKDLVGVVIKK